MTTADQESAHAGRLLSAAAIQRNTVRVLSGSQVFGGIAVAGTVAAGSLLAESVAGNEAAAGFAPSAGVVGAAVLALPLARIALTHGRRVSLSSGYALAAAGAVLVVIAAVTRSLALVYLGCALVGVASAASSQAGFAATDLALEEHRARALAWVVWAGTIGAILGPNLLNAADNLGLALGLPQYAGPYLLSAACLVIAVVVLMAFLRPDPYLTAIAHREASGDTSARPRVRDGIRHLRGRPRAILGIAVISVGHVVMVSVMVMTPVHMSHVDVTLQLIGLVISVHVAGMFAFSPLVGLAVDRIGRMPVVVAGIAVLAAACVISGLAPAHSVPLLGLGLFLLGLGWSCTLIAGSTMLTDEVAVVERPSVQGFSGLAMNAAGALGGAVAGLVVVAGSYGLLCALAVVPLLGLGVAVAIPACRVHSNTRSI